MARDHLALLERLAHVSSQGSTLRALWPRLCTAFPASWLVRKAELVGAEGELTTLMVDLVRGTTQLLASPLSGAFANDVLETEGPLLEVLPEARGRARAPSWLLGLRLDPPRGARACVVLHGNGKVDALDLEPSLWRVVARICEAALHHVEVVERVAQVSQRAHHESADLRRALQAVERHPRLIAESDAMRKVVGQAEQVADHDTTVLILGESGTGKELVARRIHERSRRASGPFVPVNCGALPESLVESELFGHERGAFTGATAKRLGRFERAHRGTLFLDEIAELPLSVQAKLLRVLQEGTLERLGGERTIAVDTRIIAATHRPLASMVRAGAFRSDLYYRLKVFPIEIPPLRERPEDIAAIVHQHLHRLCREQRRPVPRVPPELLRKLCLGSWPGNVRELENTLERALILSTGDVLEVDAISESAAPGAPRAISLHDATRECIQSALEACGGRIYGERGAAKRLGLKPSTLQTKMAKLGLRRR